MLTKYIPSKWETLTRYDRVFDDGYGNGFSFPCDEHGELLPGVPAVAHENIDECMKHPERFARWNKVIKTESEYRTDAIGICECGNSIRLHDQFLGTCQCDVCYRWYNLFGQELLPPEQW